MTHPFEVRNEITVDATPDEVWAAIASGPGVDSWLMGRTEIDSASKTSTFTMFGEVSSGSITAWEPGHRYATQEDKNPDGTFTAFEWLIESRDGDDVWGTVGVSENIIEASWLALVDAFEYKLFKDEEK